MPLRLRKLSSIDWLPFSTVQLSILILPPERGSGIRVVENAVVFFGKTSELNFYYQHQAEFMEIAKTWGALIKFSQL